ncbi:hypothetical protein QG37_07643 [Candidozyma auris]|uniref:Uncharacterized protein n=1 Tax=Candidozyma auris TaxID=498019 RepID=A0A0L0NQT9_CANAR|nr:hypothetical protein QG37_07643 [[Candida] auris]
MGDKDLMVCTKDTGIMEVALWLVMWPKNWKMPMGKVVEMMNALGVRNLTTEQSRACKFGMDALGK